MCVCVKGGTKKRGEGTRKRGEERGRGGGTKERGRQRRGERVGEREKRTVSDFN